VRIDGPVETSFPGNTKWKLGRATSTLDRLTIKFSTRARLEEKMKTPPAEAAWRSRLCFRMGFAKVWRTRPMYVSARDTLTWFKLKQRNLYVANRDPTLVDKRCLCCRKEPFDQFQPEESMLHLTQCVEIVDTFWDGIFRLLRILDIKYKRDERFLVTGLIGENLITCKEGLAVLSLAWRCLYAAITKARMEEIEVDLNGAIIKTVAMLIGRVRAYGEKWRRWYLSQRMTTHAKIIAEKYREFKMISVEEDAVYTLNPELEKFFEILKK